MITVGWGAATDAGLVRTLNEDSYLAERPVFVVADGMGGHAAGEVASRIVIDEFRRLAGATDLSPDDVVAAVTRANDAIVAMGNADSEQAGMGTTVTGLAMVQASGGWHWMVFNVGDSRVYRFAGGHLDQVTVDHSEVEELVATGQISRREARVHQRRNIVTRSLGTWPAPQVDSWLLPPVLGDRYLLCSDGLPTEMEDTEISLCLGAEQDPSGTARHLVERAVALGGRDNVTALVIDVFGDEASDVDEDTTPRILPAPDAERERFDA